MFRYMTLTHAQGPVLFGWGVVTLIGMVVMAACVMALCLGHPLPFGPHGIRLG